MKLFMVQYRVRLLANSIGEELPEKKWTVNSFFICMVFTQYWPKDGKLLVPDFGSGIKRAYLLIDAKKTSLPIDKMGDNHIFSLPLDAPDKISTTIVVETL